MTVPTVVLFIVAVPFRYSQLAQARLGPLGLSVGIYALSSVLLEILFVAIYWGVAAVIFWRKSDDWMALLVALFLVAFGTGFPPTLHLLGDQQPGVGLFVKLLAAVTYICMDGLGYLFPNGRFVPRWTWALLVIVAVLEVPFNLPPSSPFAVIHWSPWLFLPVALAEFVTPVYAQIYRYRQVSGPVQRQQTKWVVYGVSVALLSAIAFRLLIGYYIPTIGENSSFNAVASDPALYDIMLLLLLPIPLSFGLAILRSRLWDIDILINRTLVYGALTAGVVGIYVLVVGAFGVLFQTRANPLIALLATGVVAVLFQPLRDRLQRAINRLLYGERDDPYAVVARLGQRLEATLAPDAVLPTIVETVKETLKLPYVAIALTNDEQRLPLSEATGAAEDAALSATHSSFVLHASSADDMFVIAAASGTPVDDALRLPLVYQGETIGQFILGARAPGEAFSPADRRLLEDLVRQAGVAAHAVRLTADLQRSRERLVTTREEERRRLRRDLHDGLGPTLASLAQRIDTARGLVPRDPDAATALLGDLKTQIKATIAEIRRVAYALRPPALEELPPLPAAAEVAAYRIVLEALTNVARHAHAQSCRISLSLADGLCLEIIDDGSGLPVDCRAGVGLTAMRERAAELGGVCRIEPGATGGTHVWARLPLPSAERRA